jgi:hypothetical protein
MRLRSPAGSAWDCMAGLSGGIFARLRRTSSPRRSSTHTTSRDTRRTQSEQETLRVANLAAKGRLRSPHHAAMTSLASPGERREVSAPLLANKLPRLSRAQRRLVAATYDLRGTLAPVVAQW